MDLRISGETTLLVGGSEVIAYESAKELREEGTCVLICSCTADRLRKVTVSRECVLDLFLQC